MSDSDPAQITADTLLAIDLFRDLDRNDRAAIAKCCDGARFEAGHNIVLQRDDRTHVFFIVSGTVRVAFHSKPGKNVQFREQYAGECFGELSAIDGDTRSAEVAAVTNVFVGAIKTNDFLDIATSYPPASAKVLRRLASMVRSLSGRVVELSTLGVANRIRAELLRLARHSEVTENTAALIPTPTHAELASRVSTQREAVTKEIGRLVRPGILARGQGLSWVADVERLETMVETLADS
ncbi:MAG: Crp/Fnr family transcriptional regulator [Gammaproteobacteria bacterium]